MLLPLLLFGFSKSGAVLKLKRPPLGSILNRFLSEPPDKLQLTVSFAVKVNTSVVFSGIFMFSFGPVIIGGWLVITTVTGKSDEFSALSIALTVTW